MLLKIYPDKPDERQVEKVVRLLEQGGVIIYPTDGVYAFGCDATKSKAVERIARLRNLDLRKANFSFVFSSLSQLSEYTLPIETPIYKLMRSHLPGPYTFILKASNSIPKLFKNNKRTIGIRIPNNSICLAIAEGLGNPLLSASVHDEDEVLEYTTDPELIHERYERQVDLVIDGGFGKLIPSTVVDCTAGYPEMVRQGEGIIDW